MKQNNPSRTESDRRQTDVVVPPAHGANAAQGICSVHADRSQVGLDPMIEKLRRRTSIILLPAISAFLAVPAVCVGTALECWHPRGNVHLSPYGDVNGSGSVNVADAICLILASLVDMSALESPACLGSQGENIGGDLNCDGNIDVSDVLAAVALAISGAIPAELAADATGCPSACAPCVSPGAASCFIDGECIPEMHSHPSEDCRMCLPHQDSASWVGSPDASPCGPSGDMLCQAHVCLVTTPAAPLDIQAQPADSRAYVNFVPSSNTGGASIIQYEVQVVETATTTTAIQPPVTVTGLQNGQAFTFRVRAQNSAGYSPWSEPSSAVIPVQCLGEPDGTACNDGNACTQTDACASGSCVGSNPVLCTAQSQCHDPGSCNPSNGECSNPTKANGTACNDGNACTQTDACASGSCVGSNPVMCTALTQCHDPGSCNPSNGVCSNPTKPNGTACDDGNACTQTDACASGSCVGTNPVSCTAQSQCHDPGSCNPSNGVCSNPTKVNGTACDDGNACTQTDACASGSCVGSNPVMCTALTQCHNPGSCNPSNGVCSNPTKPNGTACDDGNACTQTDSCASGSCVGSNPVMCTALSQCHNPGSCNPSSGACSNPTKADGTACDDGNACTQTDACVSGSCVGSSPVMCTALSQCHHPGSCNPSNGICSNPTKVNGTSCDDGNACTQTDACASGSCVGSNPVMCTALSQCHHPGSCNPSSGVCSTPLKADGSACSDGNPCTQVDACVNGTCVGSGHVTCSQDINPCSVAQCNPTTGTCVTHFAPPGSPCDRGLHCAAPTVCAQVFVTGPQTYCPFVPVDCSAHTSDCSIGVCSEEAQGCTTSAAANGTRCDWSGSPAACVGGSCEGPVLVPAGWFWMGCNGLPGVQCAESEFPYRQVYLDAFRVDATQTTAGAYKECVTAGACSPPEAEGAFCSLGAYRTYDTPGKEGHPVNCVGWFDAANYCAWVGKRLCTEAEWEKAARGSDGRSYPWGNTEPTCEFAVHMSGGWGCGTGSTWPVGSKPHGVSPYGAYDMAGNVWDWVADWFGWTYYAEAPNINPVGPATSTFRSLRGGGHADPPHLLSVSHRSYHYPDSRFSFYGFRCCQSIE